jgi:DNA-directed RNA polymerase specialized sigma24 family protein
MSQLVEAVDATLYFSRFRLAEASESVKSLVAKAVNGDKDAFATLFAKLTPKLKAVIRRKSRGMQETDVEDVLADVWLGVVSKGLDKHKAKPEGLIPYLVKSVKNRAITAGKKASRYGSTHLPVQPGAIGIAKKGGLSEKEKKVVRAAVTRALAAAKLSKQEKALIVQMFGVAGNELKLPDYGKDLEIAKAAGVGGKKGSVSSKLTRAKKKFLQQFCTDQALCDLIPSGHRRDLEKKIPGLGVNVCKDVPGSCVEEFAAGLLGLTEEDARIEESEAEELVLSWLTEVLARE